MKQGKENNVDEVIADTMVKIGDVQVKNELNTQPLY
jgi:hypothetical protein